jgi:catechol 2,3-dioxygenase-like lactoylglutathione lyase family enzyme
MPAHSPAPADNQQISGDSMSFKHTLACAAIALTLPLCASAGIPGMKGGQHLGITVPNMDEAVKFFVDVIGCEESIKLGAFKFADDWMNVHLNVDPRAEIKRFQMVRCGHGINLEVFEYGAPRQAKAPPKNSDVGGHHLAFYVDDMDKAVAYLKSKGVRTLGAPSTFTEGPAAGLTWMYFLSPWGMQLEIVSTPKGMAYEKNAKRILWDPRFPAK